MSTETPPDPSSSDTLPDAEQDPLPANPPDEPSSDAPPPPTTLNADEPLDTAPDDAELDAEINPTSQADAMNLDGASDPLSQPPTSTLPNGVPPTQPQAASQPHQPAVIEPRIPQKKDASLRDFIAKMDDYAPLIPDAVTDYYLTVAGLPPPPSTDRRLARLLALATQKFIADVAADAYQYSRIRSTNTTSNNPLTGLGGAAGFGTMNMQQDAGKAAPLGGPRAGYGGGGAGGGGQGRTVLTMEDLGMAVGEYGVNVKRGEFYR
ncbi:transcription initiation factor TFIID 23-30kDa subunit-domain-containing protein [Neohortaea acidophila]|uniref:Transcription initiation factor TFIID 23-30kDa subunit-domain-containing protein n=1 Tax=Neohortaea acidophila TaxID=245834 RepID=A0A6A6PT66_9PEZI|nr:transcription initiation factor TFIID 23-30kDa subunit-domain-containing protein [Neohortaea acidophila]KAF2482874.1 transcription initiation factor TFIID 23-30kDa subunit-domain-containing protein [Neohortaea acidophila]